MASLASLRGLSGFGGTSTEIAPDRARGPATPRRALALYFDARGLVDDKTTLFFHRGFYLIGKSDTVSQRIGIVLPCRLDRSH